jgi:hypothetical protein
MWNHIVDIFREEDLISDRFSSFPSQLFLRWVCGNFLDVGLHYAFTSKFFLVKFFSSHVPPWCYSQTGFPKWLNPATVAVIHTWEIWLQVREDSRHFLESCYVLATSKNPASKYGDLHVFLLRTWSFSTVKKKRCSVDFAQKNLAGWINGQDFVGEFQVVEVPPVPVFFSRLDSGQ